MTILIYLLFFAIGTGLFVDLLFFALGDPNHGEVAPGRIFSKYGEWALVRMNERAHEIDVERQRRLTEFTERFENIQELPPIYNPPNWWKLLVCPRCFNAWATNVVFFVLFSTMTCGWWWLLAIIPFQGFSSLALAVSAKARQ